MNGWDLRERRRAEGLTLRSLARVIGTAESNVSAYERGTKTPNAHTIARMMAALDAGRDSVVLSRSLLSAPAASAELRAGLRQGWRTPDLLRVIREMRSNAKFAQSARDRAIFFAEPSTTGDQRWDAMLAANTENLAILLGITPPTWTPGHALPQFWFVGSMPSLHAYALARTPMSMLVRGVIVDPDDLESV